MKTLAPFYPVVDSAEWMERLARNGAGFIQLRMKDRSEGEIRAAIVAARAACDRHGAVLVINDFWRIAIDEKAEWLHLGQEDLDEADLPAIRRAGLRFGISTHDEAELARALDLAPDYIALGPIFPTIVKAMRFAPQGLAPIRAWKRRIGDIPLVAIGGITLETASACLDAGADCVAVVSDILRHQDPEARCRAWLATTAR
ncbi:MAG: thiamine phosphate synthase [Proteobacteria bacterium]|nr:thiamine phosphate synthase [Pseudomonadota bacterium]